MLRGALLVRLEVFELHILIRFLRNEYEQVAAAGRQISILVFTNLSIEKEIFHGRNLVGKEFMESTSMHSERKIIRYLIAATRDNI